MYIFVCNSFKLFNILLMKILFSYLSIFICFTMSHQYLNAQENTEIFCQVIDKTSKKPIIYTTVILKMNKLGVISDEDGNFRIPYKFKQQLDTLRISCIGFETIEVPLINLKNTELNVLTLKQKMESLEEIILISKKNKKAKLSARKIIKKAIQSIPENYPRQPFSYIAYYRDYQQLLDSTYASSIKNNYDSKYINLNEGIIEVFDAGFGTNKLMDTTNQTVLYKFQSNQNFAIDSTLTIPYDNRDHKYLEGVRISPLGGNELNILNLTNAIRNYDRMSFSFVHVLSKHFIANHTFRLKQIKYFDDLPIYEINFELSSEFTKRKYIVEGTIFIAKNSFAIHKLTYNLYKKVGKKHLYSINIEYVPKGKQLYLNYITFNNSFELKVEDYFKLIDVSYNFDDLYFTLNFSHAIDEFSIMPWNKNFKIYYKKERLKILNIKVINKNTVKINVSNFTVSDRKGFGENISFKLKNIKDSDGLIINEIPIIEVNQFREIFVQQVFPDKEPEENLHFVNKNAPLSNSKLNTFGKQSDYWVNTPLKSNKKD